MVIDANKLEEMAKERPDECFLKGTGVLKLTGAIRDLEAELRFERSHIQVLQRALMFWLPMVPESPGNISKRVGDDAMLLMGYEGADEPSAEDLGWISLSTSEAKNG